MDDCLIYPATGPNNLTAVADLHKVWLGWCEDGYIQYVDTRDRFLSKLKALIPGVAQVRRAGLISWAGIRIRDDAKIKYLDTSNANLF
jgi:hypothetical protein